MRRALFACLLHGLCTIAMAQDVPMMSPGDPRVRYVTYRADRSIVVKVRRGVVTRLVLARDEEITLSAAGFAARCETDTDEWCIRAMKGETQVWIKPRSRATHNNLELATTKRDYSIRLEVLPDAPGGEAPPDELYRVIFVYPGAEPYATGTQRDSDSAPRPTRRARGNLETYGCSRPRRIVNTAYTREPGESLVPHRVFDDGMQTIFVFGDTSTMPAVFEVGPGQSERRVNFTVDGNCLVLHQLGPEFVLRSGGQSMRIFNEAYEDGSASPDLRHKRTHEELAQ